MSVSAVDAERALENDKVEFSLGTAFDTFGEVRAVAAQVGADTVFTFNASTTLTVSDVSLASLAADDILFV